MRVVNVVVCVMGNIVYVGSWRLVFFYVVSWGESMWGPTCDCCGPADPKVPVAGGAFYLFILLIFLYGVFRELQKGTQI